MINIFLYIALAYLVLNTAILCSNRHEFSPLPSSPAAPGGETPLKISICIPARNEQRGIRRAVLSAVRQTYPHLEVLVLDDRSDDDTPLILDKLQNQYPEVLSVINGQPKPDDWLGKSWACQQLSRHAGGDILLFMDADAWLQADTAGRAAGALQQFGVDFITVWPRQKLGSFWERVVIPIVYYGLFTLLPASLVHRTPRWLPHRYAGQFAAACGQCMVFRRSAYHAIGGHGAVRTDIVEDVALAKVIKKHGLRMRMFHGFDTVCCRMYQSGREMWQGFRKNFLGLYNDSVPAFVLMAVMNFIVYVLPVVLMPVAVVRGDIRSVALALVVLLLTAMQRWLLARWYGWSGWYGLLHWLGVLWFHLLGVQVLADHLRGQRASWKDRPTL